MIIWNIYLHQQKGQEWKAIERFRDEMHLFEQSPGPSGIWNQLREYLYGTVNVSAHHVNVHIDASITSQESKRAS